MNLAITNKRSRSACFAMASIFNEVSIKKDKPKM